jgi:sulfoxide reductase heme-binding subunit YedZ
MAAKLPDRYLKPPVFALAMAPLAVLLWRFHEHRLTADPIAYVLNRLGWWTLTFLLLSLACTPLQLLFKWNWPIRIRRMVGLFAFFYGCLHLTTYAWLDQGLDWHDIWEDVVKRKFITVGFAALVLMVPLALTSTQKMLQRLRYARWKALHRLAYVSAVLGVIHFAWRVKADETEPLLFAVVLAALFAVRIGFWIAARRTAGARHGAAA